MTLVRFVVRVGKREEGSWTVELDDGRVVSAAADEASEAASEPDVTFAIAPDNIEAIRSGSTALSVAFMRGQVKMAGDFGALLQVLPVLDSDAFSSTRADLFS